MKYDKEWVKIATEAVLEAGAILREGFARGGDILLEEGKDIKLHQDVGAEKIILKALNNTGLPILSEESGLIDDRNIEEGFYWVIDPLDGTFNYSRKIPLAVTAIALCQSNTPLVGIVYDFMNDELYVGGKDLPTTLNAEKISVSAVSAVEDAGIATGLPVGRSYDEGSFGKLIKVSQDFKKVRMLGSAVTSLLCVARGALEVYHEESIFFWDVAAGIALVEGAGGHAKLSNFESDYKQEVWVTNGTLNYELLNKKS